MVRQVLYKSLCHNWVPQKVHQGWGKYLIDSFVTIVSHKKYIKGEEIIWLIPFATIEFQKKCIKGEDSVWLIPLSQLSSTKNALSVWQIFD